MEERINAGYKIIEAVRIDDDLEVVLGKNETDLGTVYVTWQCGHGNDYFWGHYFRKDFAAARRDLFRRAIDLIS